ncbi:diaminopimelate epimerase [Rhodococcus sp. D2-41]|uniref:diaminopimelate epimerase n=1 Tax=Speluncibacter jeojiensis TaxID=2710754 RepID=UPI002410A0B4|nr:diaminopimelate epimerase [Rhodococcus sp. D2-41]MDG3011447.1 diaminopimelate epimerase [Rhodococcus sp. D2-41]
MAFLKGHGTENDFVVLPDREVDLDLSTARVTALCDRRRGIGADGVLRVARTGALVERGVLPGEVLDEVAADDWFMDYRNADGSIAEMCGNGVRVFAHFLHASGWEERAEFVVGSRAGARPVRVHGGVDAGGAATVGDVTVSMGRVRELGTSSASVGGATRTGLGIDVGNPHLACVDPALDAAALAALDLTVAPVFDHDMFPSGVNVEVLTPLADGSVDMRVFERGVGETRSCGTGTVAAAAAALRTAGESAGSVQVRVPGGAVSVTIGPDGATLRGPSVLLARGELDARWWDSLG